MKKYAFGVNIGGTTVKMGLFETQCHLDKDDTQNRVCRNYVPCSFLQIMLRQ